MKKVFTTIALTTVMAFGATFANAGIIMGDRTAPSTECSSDKDGIIYGGRDGIIYGGRGITGVIADVISGIEGIIMGDTASTPCTTDKDGIIYGGRDGIIYGG
jgi:hypothetical protein